MYLFGDGIHDEKEYGVRCDGKSSNKTIRVERSGLVKVKRQENISPKDTIPFGSIVLAADLTEKLATPRWYEGQVIGMTRDGRYKVYFLSDGTVAKLDRSYVVSNFDAGSSLRSTTETKAFSSCDDFGQYLLELNIALFSFDNVESFNKTVGEGCVKIGRAHV